MFGQLSTYSAKTLFTTLRYIFLNKRLQRRVDEKAGRIPSAIVSGVALVILAACGGSGSSSTTPTVISTQPASISALAGTTATFDVAATGEGLTYQWQQSTDNAVSWTNISGAALPSFTTAALDASYNGYQYRVLVTGAGGSVTSSAVTLTVAPATTPITISAQPTDQTVVVGASASFSVTAAGTSPSYQWQVSTDGTTWADQAGATSTTLTLGAVASSDNGNDFRVVVSNAAGSVTSSSVVLTVTAASMAPKISSQPSAATVVAPQSAMFTVVASGTPTPSYQWQVSSDNGASYADVASATAASYSTGATSVSDTGKLFRVHLVNSAGDVVSAAALLTVSSALQAPAIAMQPSDQTVSVGATATFSVVVSGVPSPTLQWQVSTDAGATFTNINGATSASYMTAATVATDSGKRYRVVVSNSVASVTSNSVTLTVLAATTGGAIGMPYGIAVNSAGTVFVSTLIQPGSDPNGTLFAGIKQISTGGVVSTFAGDNGLHGVVDGTGTAAGFGAINTLAIDGAGNLFLADADAGALTSYVREVSAAAVVTTLAGGGNGYVDATGSAARFHYASSVAVDASGVIYVADTVNNVIRVITPAGVVTTLAGCPVGCSGFVDGTGIQARFAGPSGMAVDSGGNVYVSETGNAAVRKITPAGLVTTIAGGTTGFADGSGSAAKFANPEGLTIDGSGTLFVADSSNQAIRKVTASGVVTTLAGTGATGYVEGAGSNAQFYNPIGIALDAAGNIYVADSGNHAVRKITPSGSVSTYAK